MFDECLAYDDQLRAKGHFSAGEALEGAATASTVSWKSGKALVTDGPFIETKEQIGGILVLEAQDKDQAIRLMSQHPALKYGTSFEIRPVGDMSEIIEASERRRAAAKPSS
jgi:hypothetical protein